MTRRLTMLFVAGALVLPAGTAEAQNLLTNGGLEMPPGDEAGRDTVPPGWQLAEGPSVPAFPPGPAPAGLPSNQLWMYEGDYNNSGSAAIPCPNNYGCEAITAADYTTWRNHLNTAYVLPNRFRTSTGNVSNLDYRAWKLNYGNPLVMSLAEPTNFDHLVFEGDWYMWFQPYFSTFTQLPEALDNFAHLTQTVAGTPGLNYTMSGWALFEAHFPGGRTNLNLDGSSDTPPDDGPPSPTDAFFALEFLDSVGTVLAGSVEKELMADGQLNNTTWMEHTLSAVAPAGTTNVRVRISMINGVLNPGVDPQSFMADYFSLTASAGAGGVVPEPASWLLGVLGISVCGAMRRRRAARGHHTPVA